MVMEKDIQIERATLNDINVIHDLIYGYAKEGFMLIRTKGDIAYRIRDYAVCKADGMVTGCVGLKVWDKNSAEIYALAVRKDYTNQGFGKALVKRCINDAESLGVKSVFALTFRKDLFMKLGFKKSTFKELPKIMFTEKTVNIDKAYSLKIK